jgi:hypothetical protein
VAGLPLTYYPDVICCEREMVRCRRFDTVPVVVPLNGMTVKYATQVAIMQRRVDTYRTGWACLSCDRFVVQSYASSSSTGAPSVLASSASSATF